MRTAGIRPLNLALGLRSSAQNRVGALHVSEERGTMQYAGTKGPPSSGRACSRTRKEVVNELRSMLRFWCNDDESARD
jgi:hypothetical protein